MASISNSRSPLRAKSSRTGAPVGQNAVRARRSRLIGSGSMNALSWYSEKASPSRGDIHSTRSDRRSLSHRSFVVNMPENPIHRRVTSNCHVSNFQSSGIGKRHVRAVRRAAGRGSPFGHLGGLDRGAAPGTSSCFMTASISCRSRSGRRRACIMSMSVGKVIQGLVKLRNARPEDYMLKPRVRR